MASATRRAAQPASRKHALTRAVRITTDSILPLHSPSSRAELLGWLSIDALKPLAEKGQVNLDAPLSDLLRGDDSATTATTTTATATASSAERPAESTERPVKEFKRGRKYEGERPNSERGRCDRAEGAHLLAREPHAQSSRPRPPSRSSRRSLPNSKRPAVARSSSRSSPTRVSLRSRFRPECRRAHHKRLALYICSILYPSRSPQICTGRRDGRRLAKVSPDRLCPYRFHAARLAVRLSLTTVRPRRFTRRRFPNAAATTAGPGGLAPPVPS